MAHFEDRAMAFQIFNIQDNINQAQVMQRIREMYQNEYAVVHESQASKLRRQSGVAKERTKKVKNIRTNKDKHKKNAFKKPSRRNLLPKAKPSISHPQGCDGKITDEGVHIDITV